MGLALSSGYFLVFHGSRDRRGQVILSKLIYILNRELADRFILTQGKYSKQHSSDTQNNIRNYTGNCFDSNVQRVDFLSNMEIPSIGTGSLELTTIPLHKKIEKYAGFIQKFGYTHLKILPLFLNPGVHVCEDIPTEISLVKRFLAKEMTSELLPYLGSYPQTLTILNKQFTPTANDGKILLAHGTRYPQGNIWLQNLANQLNASIAYYSVSGSLQAQIENLISKQKHKIKIIPYFLFPGRITDAIATEVNKLQQVFPKTQLILGKPLGETEELANLIIEVLTK